MGKLPCPPSIITLGSSAHDVFQQAADLRLVVVGNVGEHAAEVTCALQAMRPAHPRAGPGQLARHAFEHAREAGITQKSRNNSNRLPPPIRSTGWIAVEIKRWRTSVTRVSCSR